MCMISRHADSDDRTAPDSLQLPLVRLERAVIRSPRQAPPAYDRPRLDEQPDRVEPDEHARVDRAVAVEVRRRSGLAHVLRAHVVGQTHGRERKDDDEEDEQEGRKCDGPVLATCPAVTGDDDREDEQQADEIERQQADAGP